ncbi:hypothetical protein E2C01_087692 [Portunus trituberculatus]|uniref:Uncharacterized protein n=1 Tax=Portunus trituberculatus TaxID=210409 RepID=A0A5B7JD65_PORTR|nr:hypothetical protein [Portunus trituberculatus]
MQTTTIKKCCINPCCSTRPSAPGFSPTRRE